jgi:hypothetical protein
MAFYLYVPNDDGREGGTIVGAFEERHSADCEAALVGGRSQVIEAPKPSFRHLHAFIEKGWTKCAACGRPTPPWRQVKAASESEGGK